MKWRKSPVWARPWGFPLCHGKCYTYHLGCICFHPNLWDQPLHLLSRPGARGLVSSWRQPAQEVTTNKRLKEEITNWQEESIHILLSQDCTLTIITGLKDIVLSHSSPWCESGHCLFTNTWRLRCLYPGYSPEHIGKVTQELTLYFLVPMQVQQASNNRSIVYRQKKKSVPSKSW